MKTKTNFCGTFAIVFMVATAIIITSCSQDDDDYNSDMYTLAEKMETRSGGDPGGGQGGYYMIAEGDTDIIVNVAGLLDFNCHLKWSKQNLWGASARVSITDTIYRDGIGTYKDSLGIDRTMTLVKCIDMDINPYASYREKDFVMNGTVYYALAIQPLNGTYGNTLLAPFSLTCPVPEGKIYIAQ